MSDIGVRTTQTLVNEDQRWIAPGGISALRDLDTITLDMKTAAGFSRVNFPNSLIPSGVALGKITATGLYGPYDDTAVDGRAVCVGLLAVTVRWDVAMPVTGNAAAIAAALYWHGEIIASFLPANNGLDAAGKADIAAKIRIL